MPIVVLDDTPVFLTSKKYDQACDLAQPDWDPLTRAKAHVSQALADRQFRDVTRYLLAKRRSSPAMFSIEWERFDLYEKDSADIALLLRHWSEYYAGIDTLRGVGFGFVVSGGRLLKRKGQISVLFPSEVLIFASGTMPDFYVEMTNCFVFFRGSEIQVQIGPSNGFIDIVR